MTDIQANYNVNSQAYNVKSDTNKKSACNDCQTKSQAAKKDVNLDENPANAVGRSMVNHKYKFDPENVKADVDDFKLDYTLLTEFARQLVDEGYPPERAADIASAMVFFANERYNF